jgi:hypothetical protein
MAGPFTYGLYPWQWTPPVIDPVTQKQAQAGFHSAPSGASCVLDFRPLGEQAKALQSGGYGFFAWPVGVVAPPNDLITLGTGDVRSIVASNAAKTELKTKLGLGNNPAWTGATLADCIADVLGDFSVPDGSSGPKPLMPQDDGLLVIELGGHSPVWSRAVNSAELLSANPGKRHNRIRDVIRMSIDEAHKIGGAVLAGKVLGGILKQHGYTLAEIDKADKGNGGKKTEWERLLSVGKRGSVKPKKPETTYSETWPTTGAITSGQDLGWEIPDGGFNVSQAGVLRETINFYLSSARCTSAVSSSDHYATLAITLYVGNQPGNAGPACRFSVSALTYYKYYYSTGQNRLLYKSVAGSLTQLSTTSAPSYVQGDIWRVTINGSTLTGSDPRHADATVTDTSITGNLLGGLTFYDDTNNHGYNWVGAFSVSDIATAPVAAFSGTPLSGTAPLSVVFTDSSTNTPTSWLWEKNSGSGWVNFAGTPTVQNPTESFAAGTWSVRLTATNAGGSDPEEKTNYVVVTAASGGHPMAGCYGLGVGFGLGM